MNVLLFLSDQHLATCLRAEGHPQAITPNMDRLAESGVRFRHAYTQNPICTPSRVSILSGQYCHNHGYYGLCGPAPERLPNFLGHFKRHGYHTAGIGKLHLPDAPHDWISDDVNLYAECYEYHQSGRRNNSYRSLYFEYLEALGLRDKEDSLRLPELPGKQQHEGRPSLLPYEHSVEGWSVQVAKRFIGECREAEKPFCMEVSVPHPHQCYTPERRFWDMYSEDLALPPTIYNDASHRAPHFQAVANHYRNGTGQFEPKDFESWARRVWRAYLASITQVDYALGEMLDYLEENGLAEDTIVIYGSDHGAYSGTFGIPEKAPGICSEAVCRVPMIWRVPNLTPAGHVSTPLVENIDIAPTITALCDLPPMETTDGCDITSLLRGESTPVREVAVTENPWSKALRWKNWRFVHYQPEMFESEDVGELYDIKSDPDETRNLYREVEYAEVVNQCRRLLLEWLIRTTRIVTALPPAKKPGSNAPYATASDGKLANGFGPAHNARPGHWNYL